MNAVNILLFVLVILRVWIGVVLLVSARKNKLPNLYWLALFFFSFVIFALFAPTVGNPLGDLPGKLSLWMFAGVSVAVTWVLVIFVHATFYTDKKSPIGWFLGVYGVLAIISFYGIAMSASNMQQSPWVTAAYIINTLLWGWHGWAAWLAYQGVVRDRTVEDWVKARYWMMVVFSAVFVVAAVASIVRVIFAAGSNTSALGNAMALVTLVCQILGVGLQFLAWVMPEGFRRWLNRNYQPPMTIDLDKLTEDDVFKPA